MRDTLARLGAIDGVRLGWSLSIALHVGLLGVATVIASGPGRNGAADASGAGSDEPRFTIDLRKTPMLARTTSEPVPDPSPVQADVTAKKPLDEVPSQRDVIEALEQLRSALEKALASQSTAKDTDHTPLAQPLLDDGSAASADSPDESATTAETKRSQGTDTIVVPTTRSKPAVASNSGTPDKGHETHADVLERPMLLASPAPVYPPHSMRAGEQGEVRCRMYIRADGVVDSVTVLRSSGVAQLDEAARSTLLRWSFHPAKLNGVAIACEIEHTVTFRLR